MSVPVTFQFCPNQEVSLVEIAGSFTNWTRVAMTRDSGRSEEWTISLKVQIGQHEYKYVVDQEWRHDPGQPTTGDNVGGLNNIITVSDGKLITSFKDLYLRPALDLDETAADMPPSADDNMTRVTLNPERKHKAIELFKNNLLAYSDEDVELAVIQATHDIQYSNKTKYYYFEMKVISRGSNDYFTIGLANDDCGLSSAPGLDDGTYGYHGDDGKVYNMGRYNEKGKLYGPTYSAGDTVGCGINLTTGIGFYTKNGKHLGKAFCVPNFQRKLYPTFGFKSKGGKLEVNLGGKPFVFDQRQKMVEGEWDMRKNCLCRTMPLPAKNNMAGVIPALNPERKYYAIELSSYNLQASCDKEIRAFVQATNDIQYSNQTNHYYFEMTVISGGSNETFYIGLADDNWNLSRAPGWSDGSYGYFGDTGNIFNGPATTTNKLGELYGPSYSTGDTVGCGINLNTGVGFYTKNGEHLGKAFCVAEWQRKLYPTFGIYSSGGIIEVNLGAKPFVFDQRQKMVLFGDGAVCTNCLCQAMPPPANDNTPKVIPGLNPARKHTAIEVSSNNLQASCDEETEAVVQATHDIQYSNETNQYYFEMKVISRGSWDKFHIGLASDDCDLSSAPGSEDGTYGYRGYDGNIFNGNDTYFIWGDRYGPHYSTGDTVGCGINLTTGVGFYTKNGEHLGKAFCVPNFERKLYPTFSIESPGGKIEVNLGVKQFVFGAKHLKPRELPEEDVEFLVKATNTSEKKVIDYYKIFKVRHPNGRIDMKEFMKMTMDFIAFMCGEIQCDPVVFCTYTFKSYDTDENGFISFKEAAYAMYTNREDGPKEEKIKFAFRMFDINKNGTMEKKELIDWMIGIMDVFGQEEGGKFSKEHMEKDLKEMIDLIDTKKDGVISEEEFTKACAKDEELFENLCRYPELIGKILKADLEKLEWEQDKEEMEKYFEEVMAAFT